MTFDFNEDQILAKQEIRRLLSGLGSMETLRSHLNRREPYNAPLWAALGRQGWLSAAVPEPLGGSGLGYGTLCGLAEEFGRSLIMAPVSSSVYLALEAVLLAGSDAQHAAFASRLANGSLIGTFALAEGLGPLRPESVATTWSNGVLNGRKLAVPDGAIADLAVIVAREDGGPMGMYLARLDGPGVARAAAESFDPTRPTATLEFTGAPAEPLARSAGWPGVRAVLQRAAILLAFEQIGGADACLESARDYALQRYAFGRTIGSYQAVKHRLADCYVRNALARAHVLNSAWSLEHTPDDLAEAAGAARISASAAFDGAARDLIQTLGGIGATWEHPAHLYYRRARHLSTLLGTPGEWSRELMGCIDRKVAH